MVLVLPPGMDVLLQDFRYAVRQLRRNPVFTTVAVLTLALGIGANTAMFSLVHGVLLRPLPYPDADRLVTTGLSLPDFEDLKASIGAFDDVAVWASNLYTLGELAGAKDGGSEQVMGAVVSTRFFPLLGRAALGRALAPEDADRDVVVLGHRLWVRRFAQDTGILGKSLRLYGKPYEIVGVMPPEFQFPNGQFQLFVPMESAMAATPEQTQNRALRIFRILARLRPGVTLGQAQAEVDSLAARLARDHPQTNAGVEFALTPVYDRLVGGVRPVLLVLMGVVVLVLAIACANLANLLLARARSRERETAVRAALGAARSRLLRQHLTESVVLSLLGAGLGLVVAGGILDVLPAIAPFEIPRFASVRIDRTALTFTTALAVATGLFFGLAPAWLSAKTSVSAALHDGVRGSEGPAGRRLRGLLTSAEIALSLVLVIGAGLLVQSLLRLVRVDAGFRPERLLTFHVVFVKEGPRSPAQRAALAAEVAGRVAALPGVTAAGGGTGLPPVTPQRVSGFEVDGVETTPGESRAYFMAVTPGYFGALGTPIVEGRAFGDADAAGAPDVVILGRTLARRLFGTESALGRRIRLVNPEYSEGWRTVVGVAGDVRYTGLAQAAGDALYTPFAQTPFPWMYVMVRTSGRPEALARTAGEAVASVDPGLTAAAIRPMEQVLAESVAQPRFNVVLVSAFACLALALAGLGVYGVMSYSVAQRVREIGIRLALGASRGEVVRQVTGEGLRLAGAGIGVGLLGAAAATRLLEALLFEVRPLDLATFLGSGVVLAAIALVASALPAARASRVDPSSALRAD
jgi:putative ABC transport system permease protein